MKLITHKKVLRALITTVSIPLFFVKEKSYGVKVIAQKLEQTFTVLVSGRCLMSSFSEVQHSIYKQVNTVIKFVKNSQFTTSHHIGLNRSNKVFICITYAQSKQKPTNLISDVDLDPHDPKLLKTLSTKNFLLI